MLRELLLGVGLSSAFVAGAIAHRTNPKLRRSFKDRPILTLACVLVISCFSIAQLTVAPFLLPMLMRDAVRADSDQPWRLATSLLVQDGGWSGAAFNLIGLMGIGTVAEVLLGRWQWGVVAVTSVVAAQLLALSWQPAGAGNSILNFGLAGAVCAACLTIRPPHQLLVPAMAALVCFVLLLVKQDIHGAAAAIGALVAWWLLFSGRRQNVKSAPF